MRSIRAKIMWMLIGCILIVSLIIGTTGSLLTASVIEKNSTENMNLLCKTNADEVDIVLAKIEDSVDTLSHNAMSELSDLSILKDDALRKKYSDKLKESALHHIESTEGAAAVYMYFDAAYIGKIDGFFYVNTETNDKFVSKPLTDVSTYDESDTDHVGWWYIPTRKHAATWLEAYYNENFDCHIMSYIVPMYKDGQLIGVIGADISTEHIENLVRKISIFNSGKAAVLKSDGTVMYHPNFNRGDLIGKDDPGFDGVVEALAKKDRTDSLIKYELDGVEKRIASYKLRNGMLMVCFAPVSEIYKDQNSLVYLTILITAIVIVFSLLVAFFVSRKMARPIKKLNEAAKHLMDDDFDFNIDSNSRDEIGELTSTFIETRRLLKHQLHLLDAEAHCDGLTGVGNKSAFMDREIEINKAIANGNAEFSIAVFDVNKLKITNDVFGHMAGDRLLLTVSEHLSASLSPSPIYRIGGDEFVVIFENEQNENRTEIIRKCVSEMENLFVEGYPECKVSCAYGVSTFDSQIDSHISDVLRRADKEMYKNKAITKKETFPWQEGAKGIKQLQVEKYCQLLQTLTVSTDDHLFLMNIEKGNIHIFGKETYLFDISGDMSEMLALVHSNDHEPLKKALTSILNHDIEYIDLNFRMLNNNSVRWVNCRGSVIKDETDSHFVLIGRISQNAVKHLYNHVTTLFNKTKFKSDLQSGAIGQFSCLMLIDIDNLSEINLKHGSVYGDGLLRLLAEELERRFSMWRIYHSEKDRFIILLDVDSSNGVHEAYEGIKSSLSGKCTISASVVPNDRALYVNAENIYDYAVQLLNNSKKEGIGQLAFFSKDGMLEKISTVELTEQLEQSIKDNFKGFHLVYQPQILAQDYTIVSAEALLRFESKNMGEVYPDRFIPILEQTGLINEVGIWVMSEALSVCKKWREIVPDFRISVNISTKQLERKRVVAQISKLLSMHDLPGDSLILEITESAQLDDNEEVFAILTRLRNIGIQIAIDDFGTGYSNLGNLKHIHANILKVDRVFIRDIKENGYNYNLIYNVIEFARSNSLKVCLEGVETMAEFIVLSGLQPDYFQGYLFDKPCTAEYIEEKYFNSESEEYSKRLNRIESFNKEKRHAPVVNMEMKAILQGINIGLWILSYNEKTGEGELFTDETMRSLIGVDDTITPKECFKHLLDNIKPECRKDIEMMIDRMKKTQKVIQAEYVWNHPQQKEVTVRCSGRCVSKDDDVIVFEGFHRVI